MRYTTTCMYYGDNLVQNSQKSNQRTPEQGINASPHGTVPVLEQDMSHNLLFSLLI